VFSVQSSFWILRDQASLASFAGFTHKSIAAGNRRGVLTLLVARQPPDRIFYQWQASEERRDRWIASDALCCEVSCRRRRPEPGRRHLVLGNRGIGNFSCFCCGRRIDTGTTVRQIAAADGAVVAAVLAGWAAFSLPFGKCPLRKGRDMSWVTGLQRGAHATANRLDRKLRSARLSDLRSPNNAAGTAVRCRQAQADWPSVSDCRTRWLTTRLPVSPFSVSQNGVLVYGSRSYNQVQLAWHARDGARQALIGGPGTYAESNLSPNEKRLAVM